MLCNSQADCFKQLENLTRLSLKNNQLDDLPLGIFDSLVNLEKLVASENQIRQIKRGLFDHSKRLFHLDLSSNPLESIDDNSFYHLGALEELNLYACQLQHINARTFNGLKQLRKLYLDRNKLATIQETIDPSDLGETLSPSNRQNAKIKSFGNLESLYELSLSQNNLKEFDCNWLRGLPELGKLDIAYNQIPKKDIARLRTFLQGSRTQIITN